jgi:hypothetical protein
MAIDPLPDAPSRSDVPADFIAKADAFVAALPNFVTQANAQAAALTLNSTNDTSASSVAIGTGAKTFTVSASKSFQPGMYLVIADTAAPSTNSMYGQVTSYSGTTLIMNIISVLGSGTKTAWTISLAGAGGAGFGANTFTGLQKFAPGANIASAATINLSTATGNTVHITGTTPISAVTLTAGQWMECIFDAACPLTYNATTHKLNTGGVSTTLAAGDSVMYFSDGTTVYGFITKADGGPIITASNAEAIAGTDNRKPITAATLFAGLNATGSAPLFAARAFINFNGTGTPAIRASGNVTSLTDNGVGDWTINFTTALPDANYAINVTGGDTATGLLTSARFNTTAPTTSAARIGTFTTAGAAADLSYVFATVFR